MLRNQKQQRFGLVLLILSIFLTVGVLFNIAKPVKADQGTGLVAHYSFDDIDGTTLRDSSGNNNDGIIYGGASVEPGRVGNAMRFDGDDDYVDIRHRLVASQNPELTYSFFVKVDADADFSQFFLSQSSEVNASSCFNAAYNNTAHTIKTLSVDLGNSATIYKTADLSQWTHIAVTNSPSTHETRLFVNGIISTGLDASCSKELVDQFLLGRAPYYWDFQQHKGLLDEVRIYNRVLSNSEISQLGQSGNTNSITITTLSNNQTIDGSVTLESSVSGSPAISSVQYYYDDQAIGSPITVAPYTLNWDTVPVVQKKHSVVAVATDVNGNTIYSPAIDVTIDNNPLVTFSASKSAGKTNSNIVWTTDELTKGKLQYGVTNSYGSLTNIDSEDAYFHDHKLENLQPNTTYHYRIYSVDLNGNESYSADKTFKTLTNTPGNEWHVTVNGTSGGDGSNESPWSLTKALSHPPSVQPGDTIWVHGGTYSGYFTSTLTGSDTAPITVRNYNNERVIIDGGESNEGIITVYNPYVWFWGLELTSSNQQREINETGSNPTSLHRGIGFYVFGAGTRFINNIIHDAAQGFGFWTPARDSELYGNIVYYNGWEAPDRGHGHGLYVQNDTGLKYIANNMVFKNFAVGLHAYTEGGSINNIITEGNTFFDNGMLNSDGYSQNMLHGGYQVARNAIALNNMTYSGHPNAGGLNVGYLSGCDNATVMGNYLTSGSAFTFNTYCSDRLNFKNNLFYGGVNTGMENIFTNNQYFSGSAPTTNSSFVRNNKYEPDKSYVSVYNWQNLDSVNVISTSVLSTGDTYDVYDMQNYFGEPIASGTFSGSTIEIPMNSTSVSTTVGNTPNTPTHTSNKFGAFILVRTGVAQNNSTPINDGQGQAQNNINQTESFGANSAALTKLLNYVYTGQITPSDYVVIKNNVDSIQDDSNKTPQKNYSNDNDNAGSRPLKSNYLSTRIVISVITILFITAMVTILYFRKIR